MPRKATPLLERFCRFLPDELPDDGCWEWQGGLLLNGYGQFGVSRYESKRTNHAHRFAWEVHNAEPIPKGMVIRHACDNRRCVNPAHLLVGTQKDNMADCMQRGRVAKGERNSQAKLTQNQVRQIRRLCNECGWKYVDLAAKFDVSINAIYRIVQGTTWSDDSVSRTDRTRRGSRRHMAKLNEELVQKCRSLHRQGHSIRSIARMHAVGYQTMQKAIRGYTWKHVP